MKVLDFRLPREGDGVVMIVRLTAQALNATEGSGRARFAEQFSNALANPQIEGIVIAVEGGSDERDHLSAVRDCDQVQPAPHELASMIEASLKPVVAALSGPCVGPAMEIALASRFRVVNADARLGLPQITLGQMPGSGATARLTMLVGPLAALDAMVSGRIMSAEEAAEIGLADRLFHSETVEAAVGYLKHKIEAGKVDVSASERNFDGDLAPLDDKIAELSMKSRGLQAPLACAAAIRNVLVLEAGAAAEKERELREGLQGGVEAKALKHLYMAEQRSAQSLDPRGISPLPIRKIGVIGSGTMGGGIAMAFANAGFSATVVDINAEALERGRRIINRNYDSSVKRGSISPGDAVRRLSMLSYSTHMDDLTECDLVIEAAFEDMAVKKDIFGRLDAIVRRNAILATNTSYLDVNEIAGATSRPEAVVGMHFFSPANVMKLLEIVRAERTSAETIATVADVGKKIGKVPVIVGVCRGFVGNRMLTARSTDIVDLLLEGATPAQVDKVFTEFGWPMGPFQMQDLAGLDISWRNRVSQGLSLPVADDLCALGRFGQKSGRGYYRYENGSRTPIEDIETLHLIIDRATDLQVERRTICEQEILERTHLPLVNEGCRIIEERISANWSDIDLVWVHGYGFPRSKGGPMFWAETYGLQDIVERLDAWYRATGKDVFAPARILRSSAAEGRLIEPSRRDFEPDSAFGENAR